MKKTIYMLALLPLFWACNSNKNVESAEVSEAIADSTVTAGDSAAAAKIIQTADMTMRVGNALKTKEAISRKLHEIGGTTVSSTLNRRITSSERMRQSTDSLLEVSAFNYDVRMKVSVPAAQLEAFLHAVQGLAVYVDSETLMRDDQQLKYLENRLLADNRKKLLDMTAAKKLSKESEIYTAVELNDDYVKRKINNLAIDQRVRFSTVVLDFYEAPSIARLVVANDRLSDFRPPFFSRLWMNMVAGWEGFKELLLWLAHLWMLPVMGLAVYLALRRYRRKGPAVQAGR